jgi:hypothetical protein
MSRAILHRNRSLVLGRSILTGEQIQSPQENNEMNRPEGRENFDYFGSAEELFRSTTKKRRARRFSPFFLRALRFFVVDFHCFGHTSTVAAPKAKAALKNSSSLSV